MQVTYLDPDTGRKHPRVSLPRRTFGKFAADPAGQFHHVCLLNHSPGCDTTFVR
jgi:hypothetical protein